MKIHELRLAIDQIEELAAEGQLDEQSVKDTLDALEGEFEEKIDNVLLAVKNLELEAEGFKSEAKRLKDLADQSEKQATRLKEYVDYACKLMNKTKFSTPHFKVSYRKGSEVVELNEEELPEQYFLPQPPKPMSKTELKQLIKAGANIPGARLVRKEDSLQVK